MDQVPKIPVPTDANPNKPVPLGEDTGREAMQFQPNVGFMSGIVASPFDSWDSNCWDQSSWGRTGSTRRSPGLFAQMNVNGLPLAWPGQYAYFRRILNDPSVRFVRSMAFSPILGTKWIVKSRKNAPKEAAEMIQQMLDPLRAQFLDDAVRALDYGWAGFEQCYEMIDGVFWLKKIKALMHDLTSIYVESTGEFSGFNNNAVTLDAVKCLLFTYDQEAGNLYGRGRCNNLLEIVPWWRDANEGAAQYDRKIAGVFLICHYPPGESIDQNGQKTENYKIAQKMLDSVVAGRPIAVCNEFAGEVFNDMLQNISMADRTRWKLEILEDKGSRQPGFRERLEYLDKQKARAYNVPERAAFEAQRSGSKADSESHGDIILVQAEYTSQRITQLVEGCKVRPSSIINNILRMNWGPSAIGTVELCPVAIEDDKKNFLRDLAKEVLADTPTLLPMVSDVGDLFEQAGMPLPTDPPSEMEIAAEIEKAANPEPVGALGGAAGGKLSRYLRVNGL